MTLPVTQWPSDTLIVFERGQGGVRDLWMVNLSDPDRARAETYLSSEADLRYMVVSPDGTLAAYRSNESGQNEIYIRSFPVPGERTIVSQGGGDTPFWSPDGSTLYYLRGEGEAQNSTLVAARLGRNPVPVVISRDSLFTMPILENPMPGSSLHPDGDSWIFVGSADPESRASEPERLILVQNFESIPKLVETRVTSGRSGCGMSLAIGMDDPEFLPNRGTERREVAIAE